MQAGSCLVDYKDLYSLSRVLKVREPRFKSNVLTARSIICLAVGVPHFKDNVLVARYMSTAPTDFASTSYGQIYGHTPSCFASTNNVTIKSIFDVNKWDIKNFVSTNNLTEFKHDMSSYVSLPPMWKIITKLPICLHQWLHFLYITIIIFNCFSRLLLHSVQMSQKWDLQVYVFLFPKNMIFCVSSFQITSEIHYPSRKMPSPVWSPPSPCSSASSPSTSPPALPSPLSCDYCILCTSRMSLQRQQSEH